MLCSQAGLLLEKLNQSIFSDGAGAVQVEFAEPCIEIFIVEAVGITRVCEIALQEMLGLLLVEGATVIVVELVHRIVHGFPNDKVDLAFVVSHGKTFLFFA